VLALLFVVPDLLEMVSLLLNSHAIS